MKKLLLTTFLLFSIIGNNTYALTDAGEKVILIEKEGVAPFRGYLFPEDKALQFRKELLELDTLRELKDSYERSIALYKTNDDLRNYKVNMLMEQNDKLAKAAFEVRERNNFEDWMWFGAGVLVTGIGISIGLHNR